jgi:ethanolamine-phosphate cytidylyltransferase
MGRPRIGFIYIDLLDLIVFFICPIFIVCLWQFSPDFVERTINSVYAWLTSDSVKAFETTCHDILNAMRVPPPYPTAVNVAMLVLSSLFTLVVYFVSVGRRHWEHRKDIETELVDARAKVQVLEDRLHATTAKEVQKEAGKPVVRIFMDGAFDLMHYGHMNAFRLGSSLGHHLVVGVNSSETIAECKGFPPIMSDNERCNAVKHCRFVDETIERSPYVMTQEYLEWVIKEYDIDFVVHGDDPCLVNGEDVYGPVKKMGKFKSIPRTEGISTTDLVGRILTMVPPSDGTESPNSARARANSSARLLTKSQSLYDMSETGELQAPSSRFMTTSSILRKFSAGMKSPPPGAKIVYIDGSWDMFHSGHIDILKRAREEGDYLIAGVFSDAAVAYNLGEQHPVMTLNERMLSVIGCKLVDDVLFDAPLQVDDDMIASLEIKVVITANNEPRWSRYTQRQTIAQNKGILKVINLAEDALQVEDIVGRLNANRDRYEQKYEKKKKAEDEYYDERYKRV